MSWKIDHRISYETGIHVGDGNMYSGGRVRRITYSGNLENEKEFYEFLSQFIRKIFGVEPTMIDRPEDNTVLLIINSKDITEFKNKKLELPFGPKDEIEIPKKILENPSLIKWFMRGLGDTDFSISFKKNKKKIHKEPRLEWYSKSKKLTNQVEKILKRYGFTFSVDKIDRGNYHGRLLRMYGNRNLELWLKEFGFSNHWIKLKIKVWRKLGYYPIRKSYKELMEILEAN